ncbi:unnamed protein product [Brassica oleracea]
MTCCYMNVYHGFTDSLRFSQRISFSIMKQRPTTNENAAGNASSSTSNKYGSKEEKEEAETKRLFRLESFSVVDETLNC